MPERDSRRDSESAGFQSTCWDTVRSARGDGDKAHAALEIICAAYWTPLYSHLRKRGHDRTEAEDLVQGFFAACIEKHYLYAADQHRGRFRSFLKTSLDHYAANQRRHLATKRRGGNVTHVSLDMPFRHDPPGNTTPQKAIVRSWAESLIAKAIRRMERQHQTGHGSADYNLLRQLVQPASGSPSTDDVAARLDISAGAVRARVHRLRQELGHHLRQVIAESGCSEDDVDEEIGELFAAFQ